MTKTPPDEIYIVDLNESAAPEPLWEILRRETQPAEFEDGNAPVDSVRYFRHERINVLGLAILVVIYGVGMMIAGALLQFYAR